MDLAKLHLKPFDLSGEGLEWVKKTFETLNLREKIGQILIPNTNNPTKKNLGGILSISPGGVFLAMGFTWKARQWRAARFLQENSKIPLLIAGDLELGGLGGALNATFFATQMGVGATNDVEWAKKFGMVVGREGAAMGYNWTFSPVVDINYNPQNPVVNVRAFGDRPDLVLEMGLAHVRAVQACGLAACAKHWPGDGMDDRDQHLVTSVNDLDMTRWRATYGKVYRGLIEAGVKTVMSAHIALPAYFREDGDVFEGKEYTPATLSPELTTTLLREELGFNGLVVSDATGMGGLLSHGSRADLLPRLINAGNDMQLFTYSADKDAQLLIEATETGLLSQSRLDESVIRVLGLKASLQLHARQENSTLVPPKQNLHLVRSKEHRQWSLECARQGITLVKDSPGLLPLSPQTHPRVLIKRVGSFRIFTRKFPSFLKKAGFRVSKYKGSKTRLKDYEAFVYVVCEPGMALKNRTRLNWKELKGIHKIVREIPTFFISLGSPYHLYEVPTMPIFINAYSPSPVVQSAVVDLLTGKLPWHGQSPVDPFCGTEQGKE